MTAGERLELRVSAAVLELLADKDLERLERRGRAGYRCLECGEAGGPGDGPAAVVLEVGYGPGGAAVAMARLGHERCCGAEVRGDGTGPAAGSASFARPSVIGMRPMRPALLAELDPPVYAVARAGERTDLGVSALLQNGLHLITDPKTPAPAAPGWKAEVSRRQVTVTYPDGRVFFTGRPRAPMGWRSVSAGAGALELLAGLGGLADGRDSAGALLEAAAGGRLVGGLIEVQRTR